MPKSAKHCPKCGAKQGLPVWVIVIIVIVIIGIIGSSSESEDSNSTISNDSNVKKETVEVADFSTMTQAEIDSWCNENSINCEIKNEYSDTVEKEKFISQSIDAGKTIYESDSITIVKSLGKKPTVSQVNAVKKAESYLSFSAFSRKSLIEQLEYEKFSHEDAEFAVDHITVDWNEQAAAKAKSYLSFSSFSRDGLIEQLEFEGFTREQAEYGVTQNGL